MMSKKRIFVLIIFSLLSIFIVSSTIVPLIKATKQLVVKEQNETKQFSEHEPILITNDIGFQIFPGDGTKENPYRIENLNISSASANCGINISRTSKFFIIQNCLIDVIDTGIWIFFISEGTGEINNNTIVNNANNGLDIRFSHGMSVLNNKIMYNGKHGISSIFSERTTISNNLFGNNGYSGISFHYTKDIFIVNNIYESNRYGIDLANSINTKIYKNYFLANENALISNSNLNSKIESNLVQNNTEIGFFIKNSERIKIKTNEFQGNKVGIKIENNIKNLIYNNTLYTCSNKGIFLFHSNDTIIHYNRIYNSGGYGIFLNNSAHNIVHHNNLINNNLGGISQAYSRNGLNNSWYDLETNEGNFWDNWIGTGTYEIEGFGGEFDYFPQNQEIEIPRPEDSNRNLIRYAYIILALIIILAIIIWTAYKQKEIRTRKKETQTTKEISKQIKQKLKFAYSKEVGIGLFRFGKKGGELVIGDFGKIELDIEMFVGYAYVTIGQGQRYETGVYGPIPAPSLPDYNAVVFSFWGKDDQEGDPRMEGKQYYLVTVLFNEDKNDKLVSINNMKKNFDSYIKNFEYPNRLNQEELNYFREIVFVKEEE